MASADKTAKEQRGRPFKPGKSGNSNGRPKGALNKSTLAAQALLEGEAEALTRKAIELAKDGDIQALRLCFDRLLPPRRDRPVTLQVASVDDAGGLETASAAVLQAVLAGEITPSEGQGVSAVIEGRRKVVELTELDRRVSDLERNREEKP